MKAVVWFLSHQVRPNLRRIFLSADMLVTVVVGLVCFLLARDGAPLDAGRASALASAQAILTYAAIGGGFALSGLTVAATFPPESFLRHLAAGARDRNMDDKAAIADLWFVFAWAAWVHVVLAFAALAMLALRGYDPLAAAGRWPSLRAVVGSAVLALTFYAVLRFLVTIVTVVQAADVYVAHVLKDEDGANGEGTEDEDHAAT